tara:strand:- start:903 stop:1763 length:861 start_codon:yes stop_codon:yes gene_type:complete
MKILITGVNGLLGSKLFELLNFSEHDIISTARSQEGLATTTLDITNEKQIHQVLETHKPDVLFNTAAIADVDLCEVEKELCWNTNVKAVGYLVDKCKKFNVHLIHISTDYIFDGTSGPYIESDDPNPISYYGKSKFEGEKVIVENNLDHTIIRTILVYGVHAKSNIVSYVKQSLENGNTVNLVDDQHRMPTFVDDLANACISAANKKALGVFHVSGSEMLNYYEIGLSIADYFSLDASLINKIKTLQLNQKARRPELTGFILDKAKKELDYKPTSFENSLEVFRKV